MNKYLKFKSIKTKSLTSAKIKKILLLKKQIYNFSLISQKRWFYENINLNDINNLLIYDKKIIGYTALRIKKGILNKKQINLLIFDTFLVDKTYRKKGFGAELMKFNNHIIKKKKLGSLLICEKSMIKFYKKFNWFNFNKNKIKFLNHDMNKKNVMLNNFRANNIKNFIINL